MPDIRDTSLNDVNHDALPLFFELLARFTETGIPTKIINTMRSQAQHDEDLHNGTSWTKDSKHLPRLPDQKSDAIDVCPWAIFQMHGPSKLDWDASDPVWVKMAAIGKRLGLRCGFYWTQKDCGHFEVVRDATGRIVFYLQGAA